MSEFDQVLKQMGQTPKEISPEEDAKVRELLRKICDVIEIANKLRMDHNIHMTYAIGFDPVSNKQFVQHFSAEKHINVLVFQDFPTPDKGRAN